MEPTKWWLKEDLIDSKIKKTLTKYIRTKKNHVFGVSDIYGIKLLLMIQYANLCADIETTIHYLLHCRLYSVQWVELLTEVYKLRFYTSEHFRGSDTNSIIVWFWIIHFKC